MTVFVCRDDFENIMCGVYDAWMSGLGHENVRLELYGVKDMELFCEYRAVVTERGKAGRVAKAVKEKISPEAYETVYQSALSRETDKADKIYRFLIWGFRYGGGILDMLQIPAVHEVFRMRRYVSNEAHLLLEFLRFAQMSRGILFARIGPKNDVLELLAPHFADRLSGENWIIYDENRKKAVFHPSGRRWALIGLDYEEWKETLFDENDGGEYEKLWKCFFESISIKERENPSCQRNHLPHRYRSYMTEFQGGK